jgi:hypothetical protein
LDYLVGFYASDSGLLTIIDFSTKQPRIMINKNLDLVGIDNKKSPSKIQKISVGLRI